MKKFLLLFTLIVLSIAANAQTSVFSDLIFAFEESRIPQLKALMEGQEYPYQGFAFDNEGTKKFWFCRNCTINKSACRPQSISGGNWYAYARAENVEGTAWTEFHTNDFRTWDETMKSASRNGYTHEGDEIANGCKCSTYFNLDEFIYMLFYAYDNGTFQISVQMAGE